MRARAQPPGDTDATIRSRSAEHPRRLPEDPRPSRRRAGQAGRGRHRPAAPDEERRPPARRWWWTSPGSPGCGRFRTAAASGSAPRSPRASSRRARALRGPYLAIAESAAMVGSLQVRNLATVGGNLCNAAPSADMAPPLVALDAVAVIAGPGGERRVPIADFFTGVRKTALAPGELLVELIVPPPGAAQRRHLPAPHAAARARHRGRGRGVRSSRCRTARCTKARIALAAVAPMPVRATEAERSLEGQAVTPEAHRARGRTGGRGGQAHRRPARLGRVPQAPGPRPDPPHAHDRARAREPPDPRGRTHVAEASS